MSACWIVAEAGVNWNGDRAKIVALIEAAKTTGASHVKFQAFNAAALIARRALTDQKTIDILRNNELSDADLGMIQREAKRVGIPHFYSVFDPSQIPRVLSRGACGLKIGHAEVGDNELRKACIDQSVPVWCSAPKGIWPNTESAGMVNWVYCVNEYPATSPPRLAQMTDQNCAGFSSHYTDYRIPAAAALRGAEYIEAHLCLDTLHDPEAAWSLVPSDFAAMSKLIREYESWL